MRSLVTTLEGKTNNDKPNETSHKAHNHNKTHTLKELTSQPTIW